MIYDVAFLTVHASITDRKSDLSVERSCFLFFDLRYLSFSLTITIFHYSIFIYHYGKKHITLKVVS